LVASACGDPGLIGSEAKGTSPDASTPSSAPSSSDLPLCHELELPSAPEDWYRETPVYVGNEMPIEEVRVAASAMAGYGGIWIDRRHNGWISVGFVDGDIEEHQRTLETEFPGIGVVAVRLEHTADSLREAAERIDDALPDDMHAQNIDELRGYVNVYVGLLTPDRIAQVEDIAGDDPVCVDGIDPAALPDQGPQQVSGEGWLFLGVVDQFFGENPLPITDQAALESVWAALQVEGDVPAVDFENQVAVVFPIGYSGSCPDTRFDGLIVEGERMMPMIAHTTIAQMCTADYNPRSYLVAVDREAFPAPPFYLVEWEHSSIATLVNVDLRIPGQLIGEGDISQVEISRPRRATEMPLVIETGYPSVVTIDLDCGISYLGEINAVGWYRDGDGDIPPTEWVTAVEDGLLDVELLITEGPEPILTASAGGVEIFYLPGDPAGSPCG
jgi:hypothetical protein